MDPLCLDDLHVYYCTECGNEQLYVKQGGGIRQANLECNQCEGIHAFFMDKNRLIEFWRTQRVALSIMIEEMGGKV